MLTLLLFGGYFVVHEVPLTIEGYGDVREVVFGRDFSYLLFAALAALIFVTIRIFDAVVFDFIFSRRKHIVAPLLLREILSIGLYLLLFASAISWVFKYSIAGLLTTTTVVAAVIGLALQDTLGNLFAGIALHMERSFEVGDVLRSGDFVGVVEGVTWRATRIRTFDNNFAVLPNSVIARDRIEVFPRSQLNARRVSVGVSYSQLPARVIAVLEQAAAAVEHVSDEIRPVGRILGFGESSVNYEVKYFTRSYALREVIDADIRKAFWYALQRNRMEIPFPIRTIHRRQAAGESIVDRDEINRRLQDVDLLKPLSPEEHETLGEATRARVFARGEMILRQGEAGDSMFVVEQGSVSVRVPRDKGSVEVAQLGAGSVFGEMALLTGEARAADIVALEDVIVLEISKASLQPILLNNPELASGISAKIVERRDHLESSRAVDPVAEQTTLLRRIRSYFSL